MNMVSYRLTLVLAILAVHETGNAQSTGSSEFEEVYTISASSSEEEDGIGGVQTPDTTKAQGVITKKMIERQNAGQTILNTINLLPSVNFTNSDPYGSSGGNLRIRGFDGSRISFTFDGFQLNDAGNYAIFSNQTLDPELIRSANVNLGTTDVDSPTASATGGTVNYQSILPSDKVFGQLNTSVGDFNYYRAFGVIHTGTFTNFGTKAWVAASISRNDKFKGPGEIFKHQYNARLYQPIGEGNDFLSLAVHYNQNRNNFYRNPGVNDIRTLFNAGGATTIPTAANISAASPLDLSSFTVDQQDTLTRFEMLAQCTRTSGSPTAQNDNGGLLPDGAITLPSTAFPSGSNNPLNTSSCTNYYALRINPSNTGNIRLNSRFKLPANLTFTTDAAYQFVLANGGGFTTLSESSAVAKGANSAGSGADFNRDGDFLDTIGFFTPNNTNTNRYTLLSSLIWDPILGHKLRIAYTFDLAQVKQTGEWGNLDQRGNPDSVFAGRNGRPVLASDGFQIGNRNRLSIAMLNQISAQYVGYLFEDRLRAEVGLRMPLFSRDLNQYCYTNTGNGIALCTSQPASTLNIVPANQAAPFPANSFFEPFTARHTYFAALPNVGLRFKIMPELSWFASYAQGFSAPRVDNLYRAPSAQVEPEKTNAVDSGLRFEMPRVIAQTTGWYIGYQNRIVTAFDRDLGISIDRNVGTVDTWGIDASAATRPIDMITLMLFGSFTRGELKDDIQIAGTVAAPILAPTAGKFIVETPEWMVGGRAELELGPLSVGAQGKWVGRRYATDVNDVIVPGYGLIDMDARLDLNKMFKVWGMDEAWIQVNVTNLTNTFYLGNISTQIHHGTISGTSGANPSFSIGAPRTFQGSLHVAF